MRVLLDESLPRQLARELLGFDVYTVRQRGWQSLKNGELLRRALDAGFDALLTADQNIEYQQNLAQIGIGVIVVVARRNRIEDLLPLVPEVLRALETIQPNQLVHVGKSDQ